MVYADEKRMKKEESGESGSFVIKGGNRGDQNHQMPRPMENGNKRGRVRPFDTWKSRHQGNKVSRHHNAATFLHS